MKINTMTQLLALMEESYRGTLSVISAVHPRIKHVLLLSLYTSDFLGDGLVDENQ